MTDESYSFSAAKTRLDEIVTQVRKKDTSLEKSLDLLEEGVRLANVCTELIDHADWASAPGSVAESSESAVDAQPDSADVPVTDGEKDDVVADRGEETGITPDEAVAVGSDDDSAPIGEVWSEDEAWAEEAEDDPSDGDDGHGV